MGWEYRPKTSRAFSTTDSRPKVTGTDSVSTVARWAREKWAGICTSKATVWARGLPLLWNFPASQRRNQMNNSINIRVPRLLIVDDNRAIHEDFRKVLS